MFIDRARVRVTAGKGGRGCCSFRREKYVPRGGPSGGDGGDGGSVYIVADPRYASLLDVRYQSLRQADSGAHGLGSGCHGKCGDDLRIPVPPGTLVKDAKTEEVIADLTEEGQEFLAVRGGHGGKGNARFANSTRRAPRFAELGEPGEEGEFILELKLIAEVGLVGLPNAGKSTFLSVVTAATPKIADYPFTTLSPNLGVAQLSGYRTLTIADIPGIIEGAAEGKGLGHDFLRHIERTKVLLFLIDLGDDDPVQTRAVLEAELAEHSEELASRPKIFALTKADITENRERFDEVAQAFDQPFLLSALAHEGLDELMDHLWTTVDRVRKEEKGAVGFDEPQAEYTYEAPYTISKTRSGFRVEGKTLLRAARMTDFDNDEAVRHFQERLKRMGILKTLKRMGAERGQSIFIEDLELEYHPD
ncbi:MAG: GTPase ObgE [bacterium]|nr:GTPase ObgE [bacterium]